MNRFTTVIALGVTVATLLGASAAYATPPGENGRIAYRLWLNDEQTRAAILTIRPDGSDKRWVTHPPRRVAHVVPDWSADGRWIAYVRVHADYWDTHQRHDGPASSPSIRTARARTSPRAAPNLASGMTTPRGHRTAGGSHSAPTSESRVTWATWRSFSWSCARTGRTPAISPGIRTRRTPISRPVGAQW